MLSETFYETYSKGEEPDNESWVKDWAELGRRVSNLGDMSPFRSLRDYERFVYTLQTAFPSIQRSTLVISTRGRSVAVLEGELNFAANSPPSSQTKS